MNACPRNIGRRRPVASMHVSQISTSDSPWNSKVLLHAQFAASLTCSLEFFKPAALGGEILAWLDVMIEMINQRVAVNKLARPSQVVKPRSKVRIGADATPDIAFIETV